MQRGRGSVFALAAVFLVVFVMAIFPASDADLGFHLATGRAILDMGHWPATNVLTFAETDHPWVLQQGIPALLFELLYQSGGIAAVTLCKAAVVALTFCLVFGSGLRLGAGPGPSMFASLIAAASCSFRFVERPLIFSNLMLAAVAFCLVSAGASPVHRRRWLLGAMLAAAAACHLHAGALFSFLIIVAVAAGHGADGWLAGRRDSGAFKPALKQTAALVGVAVAAFALASATLALYHPFPLRVLLVPFQMGSDPFLKTHLIEFRAPWELPQTWLRNFWIFLVVALWSVLRPGRRRMAVMLPVLGVAIVALRFVRMADLLAIIGGPAIALAAAHVLEIRPLRRSMGILVLVGTMLFTVVDRWRLQLPGLGWNPDVFPVGLLDFSERMHLRGRTYASDGFAGPYLARFYPDEKVFFFPSIEAFSPEMLHLYVDIRYGRPGWDDQLDKYGIEMCLLKYSSPREREFQGNEDNLRQHLLKDARWTLVAFDDVGEIFVRKGGVNREQAEALAITGVDPDRMRSWNVGPKSLSQLQALRRHFPESNRVDALFQLLRIKQLPTRGVRGGSEDFATPAPAPAGSRRD